MANTNLRIHIGDKNYSSWSLRGWLPLSKCQTSFEEVQYWLDTPTFSAEIAKVSPTLTVPVLEHNDLFIPDSLAICEYLNEQFPAQNLWPQDQEHRARARAISCEMHSSFMALRTELPMNCRAQHRAVSPGKQAGEDIERVISIWEQCLNHKHTDGDYLFGHFTIADAMFAPVVIRFNSYDVKLPGKSRGYLEHMLNDKQLQQWMSAAMQEKTVLAHEERG